MQNLGGQKKNILVFSEVAYCVRPAWLIKRAPVMQARFFCCFEYSCFDYYLRSRINQWHLSLKTSLKTPFESLSRQVERKVRKFGHYRNIIKPNGLQSLAAVKATT